MVFFKLQIRRYFENIFSALDRPDLKEKVINCSDVQQQVLNKIIKIQNDFQLNAEIGENNKNLPLAKNLLNTFFACEYDQFMMALAKLERDVLLNDRYLKPHYQFYTRAMRVKAYQQFLAPYKSVNFYRH